MDAVISVRRLAKTFRGVAAVDGISFDIQRGSITALLGGNGAGKTTTISMILGALVPTGGEITVLGHDMLRDRHRALARMNFSSPYVDLPRRLTVRQNLSIYARLYGVADRVRVIDELAEALDLRKLLDRAYGTLSAGQQTRAALAKALVNTPEVLLLDEPTASLDPDTADRLRDYLDRYRRHHNMTILLASHNMREVEKLCDNVLMMKAGRIVDRGAPSQLLEKYSRADMEEVFLHIARRDEEEAEAAA